MNGRQCKVSIADSKYFLEISEPKWKRSSLVNEPSDLSDMSKKILKKKQESLPPISSPFLKKTVGNLFSDGNQSSSLPLGRYQSHDISSGVLAGSEPKRQKGAKIGNTKNPLLSSKFFIYETDSVEEIIKEASKNKIVKSYSEVKHDSYFLHSRINELRNSVGVKEEKRGDGERVPTEGSQQSQGHGRQIYNKLEKYNQRQFTLIGKSPEKHQNYLLKEIKPSNFVAKHKLNHALYVAEREQIKMVRSLIKKGKEQTLNKLMQVKNYTKFIPKTIFLQH